MTIGSFRQLWESLPGPGDAWSIGEALQAALPDMPALMAPLQPLRRLASAPPRAVGRDLLMDLFALSNVDDHLLWSPRVRPGEREAFFAALGFEPFDERKTFSPLTCEVVTVSNDCDRDAGIQLRETHWPGLMFGDLVFARCGKSVRCHPSWGILEGVADKSTLHFTNERTGRPTNDLSHGWGYNSQWRTDFHRNYRSGGFAFYNVDGTLDLGSPEAPLTGPNQTPEELTLAQARELVMHRGFVLTPLLGDQWPYHWRLAVRESASAWPRDEAHVVPFDTAIREALSA